MRLQNFHCKVFICVRARVSHRVATMSKRELSEINNRGVEKVSPNGERGTEEGRPSPGRTDESHSPSVRPRRESLEEESLRDAGTEEPPLTEKERIIHQLHIEACEAQKQMYVDPGSGFKVLTEFAHRQRGTCCGSACRHCPFGHVNVKNLNLKKRFNSLFYV